MSIQPNQIIKEQPFLILLLFFFTFSTVAQKERFKWGIGGGFRFNYLGLDSGYKGVRIPDNYHFKLDYKDIYSDLYLSQRAKFSNDEKWTHIKRKDRKK